MLTIPSILHLLAFAVGLGGGHANLILEATTGQHAPKIAGPTQKATEWAAFAALLSSAITAYRAALTIFDPEHMSINHAKATQLRDGILSRLQDLS